MLKKGLGLLIALLLCMQTVAFSATDISQLEEDKSETESKLEQLEKDKEENQRDIEEKEARQEELMAQLAEIDEKIRASRAKLLELDKKISEKQEDIRQADQDVEESTKNLQQRIRAIYMAGDATNLEIILGARDFSDFLDKLELVESISTHDAQLIDRLKQDLTRQQEEKSALDQAKAEQEQEQQALDQEQENYQALVEENKELLNALHDEEVQISDELDENNEELKKLESEIQEYYAEQKRKAEEEKKRQEELKKQQEQQEQQSGGSSDGNSSGSGDVTPTGSGYQWPAPGFLTLTSLWDEDRGYANHGALDIAGAGIMGARVVAAESGTVAFAYSGCTHNWGKPMSYSCGCGGGYGNYIMIDHGNGYSTLYAHFSSLAVSAGDTVQKGQVIGYAGTTGHSTGPHLHFETRYMGEKYNPLNEFPNYPNV